MVKFKNNGFSIIELLCVVTILATLATVSFTSVNSAYVRSQVSKVVFDMRSIRFALDSYYTENLRYPSTYLNNFQRSVQIHQFSPLTTPICYLYPVPQFPWFGQPVEYTDKHNMTSIEYQANYLVKTKPKSDTLNCMIHNSMASFSCGWSIECGGPRSCVSSVLPKFWYNPTNGILSEGGFWYDSSGLASFASWN